MKKSDRNNMFNEKYTRLAYLGGFFDGEGCITIIKGKNNIGNTQYSLRIIVSNTNEYVLRLYQFDFGGRIYKKPTKKSNWRTSYAWTLSSTKAYECLKCLYPYLVIKKHEADLAFEFQNSQSNYVHGSNKLNKDILKLREEQRKIMQDLKRMEQ